ncbi:MAG: signal recognition particle protein [Chloroflexi bacterium]|jgi:signal recognition particle subunit SRP54|nr:signal recognition particle protein [Chloroflexota bacterium]MBT3668859.1 signal recognition particle protein [Chloroflexota bacterium]MBT4002238.1 signal recognition particle protein [Chloroflexota bacterium]MBT4306573.1 signal recognition particle protein [Chloroflexota bacterium]MBT4533957.1 signal recognition particle protein [Chloroflexota bacterium]
MFETLTDRLNKVFTNLRRHGKLSPADVDAAMRDVRLALLEADVHYGVVKTFVEKVKERSVGTEVSRALNPAQQVIKIVNEELVQTLGEPEPLKLTGPKPRMIMLVGLQGAGKTTTAGKLAKKLRAQGERVLLVAADPYRPAAVQQLQTLGKALNVEVFTQENTAPPDLAGNAFIKAQQGGYTVFILDTAGRSQLDDGMMEELKGITNKVTPNEVLLVVDSMIGQEAVNIAQGFRDAVPLTGLILTKIDGDARGGAAISIREVTGLPIKYLGVSEDMDGLEIFDPARLANRILGMGDMIGLIEKAESTLDADKAAESAEKMLSGDFTLEDFADQLKQVRQMGPIGQLMGMMPGNMTGGMANVDSNEAEKSLKRIEAIINSMTPQERQKPRVLDASRKRRIARGSGTEVVDVNRLLKQHKDMQRMMKRLKKSGMRGMPRMFG